MKKKATIYGILSLIAMALMAAVASGVSVYVIFLVAVGAPLLISALVNWSGIKSGTSGAVQDVLLMAQRAKPLFLG